MNSLQYVNLSMEEDIELRRQIKERYVASLQHKLNVLQTAIGKIKERNETLRFLPQKISVDNVSSRDSSIPDQETINNYLQIKSRILRDREQLSTLMLASEELQNRINKAENLLSERRKAEELKYLRIISPTAARYAQQQPIIPKQSTLSGHQIERKYLKEQIKAIQQLKEGAEPRPQGNLNIDFDSMIRDEQMKLDKLTSLKESISTNFAHNIEKFLSKSNTLDESINAHTEFAEQFTKFQEAYNEATDKIEASPFRSLISILRRESAQTNRAAQQALLESLAAEHEMIVGRLAKMGVDDAEAAELKREVKFRLLYLEHVTAIAEKGLQNVSARGSAVDPVEKMLVEIAEMESKA